MYIIIYRIFYRVISLTFSNKLLWPILLPGGLSSFPTKCTDFNPSNWAEIGLPLVRLAPDFKVNLRCGDGAMLTFSTNGNGVGMEFADDEDTRWWIPNCLNWH